jgi:hypothetical protein
MHWVVIERVAATFTPYDGWWVMMRRVSTEWRDTVPFNPRALEDATHDRDIDALARMCCDATVEECRQLVVQTHDALMWQHGFDLSMRLGVPEQWIEQVSRTTVWTDSKLTTDLMMRAIDAMRCAISRDAFLRILREHHELGMRIVKSAAENLSLTDSYRYHQWAFYMYAEQTALYNHRAMDRVAELWQPDKAMNRLIVAPSDKVLGILLRGTGIRITMSFTDQAITRLYLRSDPSFARQFKEFTRWKWHNVTSDGMSRICDILADSDRWREFIDEHDPIYRGHITRHQAAWQNTNG